MACRGMHFAVSREQLEELLRARGDSDALMELVSEIEEAWDEDWLVQTDEAWDAIHRCLNGGALEYGSSTSYKCILGAGNLYPLDDYIINALTPEETADVAKLVGTIDIETMRASYARIDPNLYAQLSADDFDYTWHWFSKLESFYQKAAAGGRAVIFAVDQ